MRQQHVSLSKPSRPIALVSAQYQMLLLLLCGFPASGKSTLAAALASEFRLQGQKVDIVSDGAIHSKLHNPNDVGTGRPQCRRALYADSTAEKSTRAQILAAAERALAPGTVVIVDSMNYIKGFRYELFCVAKTCAARYAVVHAVCDAETCVKRDALREDSYGVELAKALVRRFEPPDQRNRWDSPLYNVSLNPQVVMDCPAAAPELKNQVLEREHGDAVNTQAENSDEKAPCDWREDISDIVRQCLSKAQPLRTTMATQPQSQGGADAFSALDRATREAEASLISSIHGGAGAGDRIRVPGSSRPVVLARPCQVAELRGMRRAHINLSRLCPPQDTTKTALVDGYVDYVNAQLRRSATP
jgi:protein KTI12